jgi:hypothetical protein
MQRDHQYFQDCITAKQSVISDIRFSKHLDDKEKEKLITEYEKDIQHICRIQHYFLDKKNREEKRKKLAAMAGYEI